MTNPIDAERMAALLDGRLNAEESAALLERIAQSDESMELLADAAAIAHELDPTVTAKQHDVARRPTGWRQPHWRVAAAAALVGAVSIPWWVRSRAPSIDGNNSLALVTVPIDRSTTGVNEPWRALRGESESITAKGRAIRVGARTVDLEVSLRTGDRATDSAMLNDISAILVRVPASAPVITSLRSVAADTSTSDQAMRMVEVRNTLGSFLGRDWVATGAFIEAARVAAKLEDRSFFASARSRSMMERIARSAELDSTARQAAARALAVGWGTTAVDWATLQRELTGLLQILVADHSGDSTAAFTVQRTGTPPIRRAIEVPR